MTCKDCIHYDVCGRWDNWNDEFYTDGNSDRCHDYSRFKNKANFVELPCKVGDDFFIIARRFEKGKYTEYFIDERQASCFEYDGKILTVYDFDGIDFDIDDVYLDKSKAEAKLKELNENE